MHRGSAKLLASLLLVAAFVAAAAARYRPPPPRPGEAPPRQFSGVRAREVLREFLGDGQPRPTGSAAGAAARARIGAVLERLGLRPEVRQSFSCGGAGICAVVDNVVARIEGSRPGKSVLLSVHYDSVAAGPGASDDGVGVAAALEIARALKADPAPLHSVVLLFNEGEEDHLLGAEAFLAGHPAAKQIGAVVNLEARGTSGASLMFETSDASGWLVDLFAKSVARPASNSIYYTVYKLLPNDTDLTVYKRHGLSGLNFAFIGGEARYHTPRDDFAHADAGSLQHQGDNALAMVRALARADLDSPPHGELAFFDLLAFGVVRWPLRWMPILAILSALLWLAGAARAGRRGELRWPGIAWGAGALLLGVAATAVSARVLLAVLRASGAEPYPFVAHPAAARAAFLALPVIGSWFASMSSGRRAGAGGLWWGGWAVWAVAGLCTSIASPGLGYPFVLPSLAAGLCGFARGAHARWPALLLPIAVAAVLFCPIAWLLYDALGVPILPVSSALLALLLTAAAPAWPEAGARLRGGLAFGAAAVAVTLAVVAAIAPAFSVDNPRKLNLSYRLDADAQQARWLASASTGPLPASLAAAAPFERKPAPALEWGLGGPAYAAPAAAIPLARPELAVLEQLASQGGRTVRVHLRSPRGAPDAGIALPAARVLSVRMNGIQVPETDRKVMIRPMHGESLTWRGAICTTMGPSGVDVELEVNGPDPVEVYVWDASPGLPVQGSALLSARPAWAVPFGPGDRTVVFGRARL